MLQKIRENTSGWIVWTIVGLIIFAMTFFGIEQYFQTRIETYAAKIESPPDWWRGAPREGALGRLARAFVWETHEVSQQQFRERFDRFREQARQRMGEAYDPDQVESLESKRLVLDGLVDETILEIAARRDGIAAEPGAITKAIREVDGITVDGEFIGNDAYRIWLQSRGLTVASFEALIARQILVSTMPDAVAQTGFIGDAELERLLSLQQETRDLRFLELAPPALPPLEDEQAALAAWHAANPQRYSTEETVTINYVELDAATLEVAGEPSEAELRERYERERGRFGTEEERIVSHILVEVPADADAAAVEAARAKAAELAAQARAPGADFAALAAANSDDLGSREQGGELGSIGKGVFPKAFEEAVYALAEGEVSEPVRTDMGWHVVKLTRLVPGTVQPFEAVRAQLLAEHAETERERLFNDRSGALVDAILREPNSLAAVAREQGLALNSAGPFGRMQGSGIAALEAVRAAAFSRGQKDDRQVSDPIEVGPNHVVVIQVTDHAPSVLRPLEEVIDQVRADLQADRREKAARAAAEALHARARAGEPLEALAAEVGGVVQQSSGVFRQAGLPDAAIVREGFRLLPQEEGKPADVGLAALGDGRYALVVATGRKPGELEGLGPEVRAQIRAQVARMRGDMEREAFVKALRGQFEITIAEERL